MARHDSQLKRFTHIRIITLFSFNQLFTTLKHSLRTGDQGLAAHRVGIKVDSMLCTQCLYSTTALALIANPEGVHIYICYHNSKRGNNAFILIDTLGYILYLE